MPTTNETAVVEDARATFDHYIAATPDPPFDRCQNDQAPFLYPEATIQADVGAFAGTFVCLWRVLEVRATFDHYYALKSEAFDELRRIVTPNADGYAAQARFWVHDGINLVTRVPSDADGVFQLCRTLRNGFGHFNFRYIEATPIDYFGRLGIPLPAAIPEPSIANNRRIFICDWNPKKGTFMSPKSDTRIVETHFAHLRYHLFCFLARFFADASHRPYSDILTGNAIG